MRLKTLLPLTLLSLGIMGASVGAINSPLVPVAHTPTNALQVEKQKLEEEYEASMSKMFFYSRVARVNNSHYYYRVADEWLQKAYSALERIEQIEREQKAHTPSS